MRGRTYLVPSLATAYLGRVLDPSLFDVTTLAAAPDPARMQVRVAHTGAAPSLPGVTITSDRSGVAEGYLTADSAVDFGAALRTQWRADHGTGSGTLFARVTSIAAATVAAPVVTPAFPMKTLIIHAVDATGAPTDGFGLLMNVDDGMKYVGFLSIIGGEARVSVPVGAYAGGVLLTTMAPDGSLTSGIVAVDQFDVTSSGQTLTFDAAAASTEVSATLPRPTRFADVAANWERDDAAGSASIGMGSEVFAPDRLLVSPTARSAVGSQHYAATVTALQRMPEGPRPSAYAYNLAYPAKRIPSAQHYAPASADLAVVKTAYDTDQAGRMGGVGRWLSDPSIWWATLWGTMLPVSRTEYVHGPADGRWYEEMVANNVADDPGFVDGGPYTLAAGQRARHTWARGALGAGIPLISPLADYGFCYACRTPTEMQLGMAPVVDSQPDHYGSIFGSPDGTPVAHVTLSRNGTVLADDSDSLGELVTVPRAKGRYTMSLDVDRYWTGTTLSTRSHTEVSFTSGANNGPAAPASWYCDGCRVLPVLQARALYPVSSTGVVSAGAPVFEVQASRIQGGAASRIVSASLWLRPSGWGWAEFPLARDGSGRWRAPVDLPAYLAGSSVDVRVQASDAGGSTFDQIVSRAFVIGAPSASTASAASGSSTWSPSAASGPAPLAGPVAGVRSAASTFTPATVHRSCAAAAPGTVQCFSQWRSGAGAGARARVSGAAGNAVADPTDGYGPGDIAAAYGLTGGKAGQTVAIVDAYDNPNAEADLATYRAVWGLPACTTANGCFRKINQRGGTTPPEPDPGWGVEIALDVQAVSASCPTCKILLVEADSASLDDIGLAVNRAVKRGAKIVSNSYGTDEFTGLTDYASAYYTHPKVAQVVSSGDWGFTTAQFPAVLGNVIAVGGTSLSHNASGWSEQAWWGAGSGCSAWVAKPAWQHDKHCGMRTTADVSAVADPDTGVAIYDTYGLGPDNGWIVVGGTSLSAPLIAGMVGRAGNPAALASAKHIYNHRSGLTDVVGGSNGYCGNDYLCTGKKGYDGPTGLGTPRGLSAL
jgi:hypothetical protein